MVDVSAECEVESLNKAKEEVKSEYCCGYAFSLRKAKEKR